jgi:prephenate dehydratase
VVRRSACGTVAVLNQQSAAGEQCRIWGGKAQKRRRTVVHNKLTAQLPGALTGWFGALLRVEIRLTHLNSREAANAGTGKESEARWTRWEQA